MEVFIVTGSSKGIGLELVKQLKGKGKKVIGIARTASMETDSFIPADLTQTDHLEGLMDEVIDECKGTATSITLINNAGMVEPIGPIGSVDAEFMSKAIALNLTAPMVLSNAFISRLASFEGKKQIVNVSSGAGRKVYEGWGTYCATKSGLDHFSRVVALEQASAEYPVDIVSIAPGIIDTGMQKTIRSSKAEAFPLLEQFVEYKEKGLLRSAEQTAEKLIVLMEEESFKEGGPIVDLRDF